MSETETRYLPGLDGLRAVAVVLVVIFHGELGLFPGGFVGVSVFFTLSGFLITQVLLRELDQHGAISLTRFWTRRARRLVPAAMACIAAVCLWALFSERAQTGPSLRGDALAAIFNVANWRFALTGTSYADLFAGPSPLLHTWSLAIEEQFYLLFPVLLAGLWRLGLRRRGCAIVLAAGAALSALAAMLTSSDEIAYYGTHTRAVEVLVGSVLALTMGRRLLDERHAARLAAPLAVLGGAAAALIVAVALFSNPSDQLTIHGGLAATSIASALLVACAAVPNRVQRVLQVSALRAVGKISYGVYLYHWPLLLWARSTSWGRISNLTAFAVAMLLTLVAATLSFWLVERPIRSRTMLPRPRQAVLGYLVALGALLAGSLSVGPVAAGNVLLQQADEAQPTVVTFAPSPTTTTQPSPIETTATAPAEIAPREASTVLVLGGDVGLAASLRAALEAADPADADAVEIIDRSSRRCRRDRYDGDARCWRA